MGACARSSETKNDNDKIREKEDSNKKYEKKTKAWAGRR